MHTIAMQANRRRRPDFLPRTQGHPPGGGQRQRLSQWAEQCRIRNRQSTAAKILLRSGEGVELQSLRDV